MTLLANAPTVPLAPDGHRSDRRVPEPRLPDGRLPDGRGPVRAGRVVASVLAVLLGVATVAGSYVVAVLDPSGRALDDAVLRAAEGLGLRAESLRLLEIVGIPTVALAVLALAGPAFARGRGRQALAVVVLVLGAQAATQLLKAGLARPDSLDANSLPSGHVTLVASLGVALVLVVPRVLRPLAGLVALGVSALAGVLTMLAGWHRPSDVVAALGVVVAVTGAITLAGAVVPRPDGVQRPLSSAV